MPEKRLDIKRESLDLLKTEDTIGYVEFDYQDPDGHVYQGLCKVARPKKKLHMPYLAFTFMVDIASAQVLQPFEQAMESMVPKLKDAIPQKIDVLRMPVMIEIPNLFITEIDVLFYHEIQAEKHVIESQYLPIFKKFLPVQFGELIWRDEFGKKEEI